MKKPIILAALVAGALGLSACTRAGDVVAYGIDGSIKIWTDKATACQYIITNDNITPRLNADGKPVCRAN